MCWILIGKINGLCGFDEIAVFCLVNIRHKLLWITINNREPTALDLHHQAMAFFENMIHLVQTNHKFFRFVWNQGLGFGKTFPVPAAEYFHGYRKLITTH